jgi:Predicted Fe-S oxidoreductases
MKKIDLLQICAVQHCNNICLGCSNSSPYAPKKEYAAKDYIPWLDILLKNGYAFDYLVLTGGEPFLHSSLERLCSDLLNYNSSLSLSITTNGFWLTPKNLVMLRGIFSKLCRFVVSIYPNLRPQIEERMGIQSDKLKGYIKELYPHLEIEIRDKYGSNRFMFPTPPSQPHENTQPLCHMHHCISLLEDGRLARCAPIAYSANAPHMAFVQESKNAFFPLQHWPEDLSVWLSRFPIDACFKCPFCRPARGEWRPIPNFKRRIIWEQETLVQMEGKCL